MGIIIIAFLNLSSSNCCRILPIKLKGGKIYGLLLGQHIEKASEVSAFGSGNQEIYLSNCLFNLDANKST
jgi:hypothetical protein